MEEKKANDKKIFSIIIALALIAFAIIRLFFRDGGNQVYITVDGQEYGTYSLYKDNSFDIINEYGINTVLIRNGSVEVTDADCRDQICVKHAAISQTNETIVCLPHKFVIEIKDSKNKNDGLDGVAN